MKNHILLFILLIFFSLTACTTGSNRNRGSLSGAMEKSRDDYEDERTVPDEEDEDDWFSDRDDERDNIAGRDDRPSDITTPSSMPEDLFLILRGGASYVSDPYFDNPLDMELLLGARGQSRFGGYVFGGFKNLDVQTTHPVSQSIDPDPLILYLGVELRCYLFPRLRIFSPYLAGRMSGFTLFWSFRNELITDEDITITYDYLGGIGLDAGVGVDFIQTDTFQAGILILPQSFLFGEETARGFSNDYFNPYGTVRWSVEAGFKL